MLWVQVVTRLVPWNCQIKGEGNELEFFHIWYCLNTWTPFFFPSVHVFISSVVPWNICLKSSQEANKEWPLHSPVLRVLVGKEVRLRQKLSTAHTKHQWLSKDYFGLMSEIGTALLEESHIYFRDWPWIMCLMVRKAKLSCIPGLNLGSNETFHTSCLKSASLKILL